MMIENDLFVVAAADVEAATGVVGESLRGAKA
jgi:hypothetical protein